MIDNQEAEEESNLLESYGNQDKTSHWHYQLYNLRKNNEIYVVGEFRNNLQKHIKSNIQMIGRVTTDLEYPSSIDNKVSRKISDIYLRYLIPDNSTFSTASKKNH